MYCYIGTLKDAAYNDEHNNIAVSQTIILCVLYIRTAAISFYSTPLFNPMAA